MIAHLNRELAEATATEIRQIAGAESAAAETVDCTNRESVRALISAVIRQFGGWTSS